jgi:parallel beta-helix repeat protein
LGANNTLSHNTASGGDGGFTVDGDGNTFHANTVTGAEGNGFESGPSNNNVFTDNTVTGTGAEGFGTGGVGNTYSGNASHRNGQFGFSDPSAPGVNTYTDNTCGLNGAGGSSPAGLCDDTVP